MSTLILMPAFNEAESLPRVVRELAACIPDAQILVVDDASTDRTQEVLAELPVRWLRLSQRLGVGNAVRAGLRYAVRNDFTHVVRVDADGQHLPPWVPRLLAELRSGGWEAVTGSRYLEPSPLQLGNVRRWVQRLLGLGLSWVTGRPVTDPTSGFWAFGPAAVQLLAEHYPTGYSEPELRLLLVRSGLSVGELPVRMGSRLHGVTTLTLDRALVAVLRAMLAMALFPLRNAPQTEAGGE